MALPPLFVWQAVLRVNKGSFLVYDRRKKDPGGQRFGKRTKELDGAMKSSLQWDIAEATGEKAGVRLSVRLEGQYGGAFLVREYEGFTELAADINGRRGDLDESLLKAEGLLRAKDKTPSGKPGKLEMTDDPVENWHRLEALETEADFFRAFNKLNEDKRREIADYVLTKENIFKGRASVFSLHFDEDTGALLE